WSSAVFASSSRWGCDAGHSRTRRSAFTAISSFGWGTGQTWSVVRRSCWSQPILLGGSVALRYSDPRTGVLAMSQAARSRQADENVLAKRLLLHWERQFGSEVVVNEPFQHFYSDHVWPADVYDEILRLLPPAEVYKPLNIKEWVNAKGVSTRDKCYLPEII